MTRFATISATTLVAIALGTAASAATLTGTIRDFNASHPDMEGTIGGVQKGQVKDTLGPDGKPVWQGSAKPGFTTEANFNQWYRDVDGVNLSKPFELTLTETAPGSGVFGFASNSFFPIDGELFGNEGRNHNFHFTLELAGQFAYSEPEDSFTFTGDDDLWVFFGGKLGIDLGGVHASASQTITGADLADLGLAPNTNYALNIFFAERHTTQSNFKIETSFAITPTPVPVPAALPLLGAGLMGLALLGRRRRDQA